MAEAEDVVLLDLWFSPFAARVRIALAEKGVEFKSIPQDLRNKSELLLHSNPVYEKVPVLLHAGHPPLCESLVIVSYVDEQWTTPPLLPSSPYDRAVARFWADFVDNKFLEAVSKAWQCKGPEEQAQAKEAIIEAMEKLEEFLGEKDYFGGDRFGLVDVALVPFAPWTRSLEKFVGFSMDQFPRLGAWMERCMERESVAGSLPPPEKVYEFVCLLRQAVGIDQ